MITIVDYRTGNLGSIKNMLKKIGNESIITSDPELVSKAEKLILPGVGAFGNGVSNLKDLGLWNVLEERVLTAKIPVLGICLGAQLMTRGSEESDLEGFGWVDGTTVRFDVTSDANFKVPSMGWYDVDLKKDSKLFSDMPEEPRFYFVHSFHFNFTSTEQVLTNTSAIYTFASSFEHENILGVQFHPEKSHKYGMQLLKNFAMNY